MMTNSLYIRNTLDRSIAHSLQIFTNFDEILEDLTTAYYRLLLRSFG